MKDKHKSGESEQERAVLTSASVCVCQRFVVGLCLDLGLLQ